MRLNVMLGAHYETRTLYSQRKNNISDFSGIRISDVEAWRAAAVKGLSVVRTHDNILELNDANTPPYPTLR